MTWSEVFVWQRRSCSERSGGSGQDALARTGSSINFGREKIIAISKKKVLIAAHFYPLLSM